MLAATRHTLSLLTALLLAAAPFGANAAGTPEADIAKMRQLFKDKFPDVPFEEYANGIYALPDFASYRTQWQEFDMLSPYEFGLAHGRALWETKFADGKTFASCFPNGGNKIAQRYPYWDKANKRIRTVEMDLMECARRIKADVRFLGADLANDQSARVQLAELSAYFHSLARGEPIRPDVDFSDPDARKAYEEGRRFWWARRGQLNFACASCHVDLAGKNLGGNQPLSAALGHGTAWPAQRLEWARLDTLQWRYMTCLSQMRAKPPTYGSTIYNHLELYEKVISTDLPLAAPSMRN